MSDHPQRHDADAATPAPPDRAGDGPHAGAEPPHADAGRPQPAGGSTRAGQEPEAAAEEEPTESRLEKAQRFYGLFEDVLTPQRIGLILAGLLLLTVGWFGGLDAVTEESHDVPTVAVTAKQDFDAAPFTIRPGKVLETTAFKPLAYKSDGVRYLVMGLTVTNKHDAPVPMSVLRDQLGLDAEGLEAKAPTIYRQNDAQTLQTLQPGVTTPLALVWTQKTTTPAPTSVTLTLRSQTWRKSNLEAGYGWFDPTDVVQLTMPVRHQEPTE